MTDEQRAIYRQEKYVTLHAKLRTMVEQNKIALKKLPHPFESWALKGKSFHDYSVYCLKFGQLKKLEELAARLVDLALFIYDVKEQTTGGHLPGGLSARATKSV